ncbi:MAG: NUDIX domain-containing protein [Bdellovibrionota bacterium]
MSALDSSLSSSNPLKVSAGVIFTPQRQILVGKRRQWDRGGGLWEFPGGKLEQEENFLEALVRELSEELEKTFTNVFPLHEAHYDYPTHSVWIVFFGCPVSSPWEVKSTAHDEVQWMELSELSRLEFLQANQELVKKLPILLSPFTTTA